MVKSLKKQGIGKIHLNIMKDICKPIEFTKWELESYLLKHPEQYTSILSPVSEF